jgi:hypothetical protein
MLQRTSEIWEKVGFVTLDGLTSWILTTESSRVLEQKPHPHLLPSFKNNIRFVINPFVVPEKRLKWTFRVDAQIRVVVFGSFAAKEKK